MKWLLRILLALAGIAMIGLGIWFVSHPLVSLLTFTISMGILLLCVGVFQIISFFTHRGPEKSSGWLLAEGILSTLLGILLLANQFQGTLTIVLVFGMWVLFSGIMRTVSSFAVKSAGEQHWGWMLALGILNIIIGFICIFNPIVSVFGIVFIMGTFFILQGINCIAGIFFVGKVRA
ncbi:HdeD family acid-resistance protein [Listeria booriae]|uniref:HdeD family acid-resistance protein n=1 Tax=Listeria booriae TaxID=1552123 RepID=A0A842AVV3_9LIST|nr:HdeD family acid-resistance protein [Listeria booriae]MBC1795764.1 HdeD family acid-resistance protein [Listeria booriae]